MTDEEQDTEKADVVCDTSLLLNFVRVERLDLLADHPAYRFHLPAEVRAEVIRLQQAADLRRWLVEGGLREIRLATRAELELFAELDAVLDRGEAASIAAAVSEGWIVAMDEGGRARREVQDRLGEGRLLTTPGVLLSCIRHGVLAIDEADGIKGELAQLRFRMTFASFRELLDPD